MTTTKQMKERLSVEMARLSADIGITEEEVWSIYMDYWRGVRRALSSGANRVNIQGIGSYKKRC